MSSRVDIDVAACGVHVARDPAELAPAPARAVAIGNFDGVHLGHRAVIDGIAGLGMPRAVVTFDPHPRAFFGHEVPELCSFERRVQLLAETGVEEILALPFDREMAQLAPEAWVERYLRPIGATVVAVGADFRFGHRRAGDVGLLRELGFDVRALPLVDGVSSTRVRELVGQGRLGLAARMLGRPHELDLTVTDLSARVGGMWLELVPSAPTPSVPPPGAYLGELGARGAPQACRTTLTRSAEGRVRVSMRVGRFTGRVGERLRLLLRAPVGSTP